MKKKWLKRIVLGSLLLFIGVVIGTVATGPDRTVYINRFWGAQRGADIAAQIEERIEKRIEEQIVIQEQEVVEIIEEIVIAPKIRIPQQNERVVRIAYDGPSIFQVVGTVANLFSAVLLIGIGVLLLIRRRQAPKEKQPEN